VILRNKNEEFTGSIWKLMENEDFSSQHVDLAYFMLMVI